MEAVWSAGAPLTAREVAERAGGGLAYTTWLTVLSRLEKKGLVARARDARAHTYTAVASREDHIALLMQQALGHADDRTAALQHFARTVSPGEAAALRRALEDR